MDVRSKSLGAVPGWAGLGPVVAGLSQALADLRRDLGRPAMNRRILHRLSLMSDGELHAIGLCRQDVREAAHRECRDAARFLAMRRGRPARRPFA